MFENILVKKELFNEKESFRMYNFVNEYIDYIKSFNNFQLCYCMTTKERKNLIGPDELLKAVGDFVSKFEEKYIYVEEIGREISNQIVISYYLLIHIIKGLEKDGY